MEMLAQFGTIPNASPEFYSLYGLVLMLVSVWVVFNMRHPERQD